MVRLAAWLLNCQKATGFTLYLLQATLCTERFCSGTSRINAVDAEYFARVTRSCNSYSKEKVFERSRQFRQ